MLNGHAGATTANSSTMPSHKLPSFSSQLKTLLWKNWILKKRSPWTLIAEIVVPVFLFVLLAWVRTRRPAEIVPTSKSSSKPFRSTSVQTKKKNDHIRKGRIAFLVFENILSCT